MPLEALCAEFERALGPAGGPGEEAQAEAEAGAGAAVRAGCRALRGQLRRGGAGRGLDEMQLCRAGQLLCQLVGRAADGEARLDLLETLAAAAGRLGGAPEARAALLASAIGVLPSVLDPAECLGAYWKLVLALLDKADAAAEVQGAVGELAQNVTLTLACVKKARAAGGNRAQADGLVHMLKCLIRLVDRGCAFRAQDVQAVVVGCSKLFLFKVTGDAPGPARAGGGQQQPPAAPGNAADGENNTSAPVTPSKWVPPHRRASLLNSDSELSDSDASDNERGPARDRLKTWKVRHLALQCLAALAKQDARQLHPHWPTLFPSPAGLRPNPYSPNLGTLLLHDAIPQIRQLAAACVVQMVEGAPQRAYMALAEVPKRKQAMRGFTTLSVSLGQCLLGLHAACITAAQKEAELSVLAAVFKACGVLAAAAPIGRLPPVFLPQTVWCVHARLAKLLQQLKEQAFDDGLAPAGPLPGLSEVTHASVAAFHAFAALLGTKAPAPGLRAAFEPRAPAPDGGGGGAKGGEGGGEALPDCSAIPRLVAGVACSQSVSSQMKFEALQALQALATNYAAAFEAHWALFVDHLAALLRSPAHRTNVVLEKSITFSLKVLAGYYKGAGAEAEGAYGEAEGDGVASEAEAEAEAGARQLTRLLEKQVGQGFAHTFPSVRACSFLVVAAVPASLWQAASVATVKAVLRACEGGLRDKVGSVRAGACKALGAVAPHQDLDEDEIFASAAGRSLAGMRDDRALAVRIAAAGALASFLDGLRHASERAPVGPILHVAHAALAMCQDNVKVKASGVRSLGYLLASCDLAAPAGVGEAEAEADAWVAAAVDSLLACLASGSPKVQWNSCYALGASLANESALGHRAVQARLPQVIARLLGALLEADNFKLRTHAAAALQALRPAALTAATFAGVLRGLLDAMAELEAGTAGAAAQDFKNRRALQVQLRHTTLHLLGLLGGWPARDLPTLSDDEPATVAAVVGLVGAIAKDVGPPRPEAAAEAPPAASPRRSQGPVAAATAPGGGGPGSPQPRAYPYSTAHVKIAAAGISHFCAAKGIIAEGGGTLKALAEWV